MGRACLFSEMGLSSINKSLGSDSDVLIIYMFIDAELLIVIALDACAPKTNDRTQ